MCGIIGFIGNHAGSVIFDSLKRLEYRGYDSWGIALDGEKIRLLRKTGKISSLPKEFSEGELGLGHTRWATHGPVTVQNAHPHLSCNGEIAVVHNGIIENFLELREFLELRGFSLKSETDSEVVPNLIQFHIEKGESFRESVRKTLLRLDGNYAVVAIRKGHKTMIGARKGSPLVAGLNGKEFFLASDVPAFLPYTKEVLFLNDHELVELNDSFKVYSVDSGKEIEKSIERVHWNAEEAGKGDYPHFMLKEINEQTQSIEKAAMQKPELIEKITGILTGADKIYFIGCGTSFHASMLATYAFSKIAGMKVEAVLASEFSSQLNFLSDKSVVFAVSQSGETVDLLDAVKLAKEKKARIVSIVNVMGSSLTRISDETIMMNSGPEICVLSTKSYTSQLAILLLLAFSAAGKTIEGKEMIKGAGQAVKKVIEESEPLMKELAEKMMDARDIFVIGKNSEYPSAMEAALKIKEVSYIHAEGFAGAELKHGSIALIEKGVPVIALISPDTEKRILSNAMEVKARGAFLVGIGPKKSTVFDEFIEIPEKGLANSLLHIIPVQLLAYHLAVKKGLDPDKPRNLAKSVTVR